MTALPPAVARAPLAGAAPSRRGRGGLRGRAPGAVAPYLFLAPFLLLFLAFQVAPMIYALWLSLFRERLVGGTVFVGLDNYADVLTDPSLWRGVGNMALFGLIQVPVMLGIALVLALLLDSALVRGRAFFRTAFYLPYAVPSVVAALVWGYLYGPVFGPFAQGAEALGLGAPNFLSAQWMIPSLANIVTWQFTGYNMVILFAALQAVPRDLEEAASLDGAGPAAFAWHVKVPLIRPAIILCVIFSIIGTFQLFNEPRIMASIAPNVIGDDYTPTLYAFSLAFTSLRFDLAAALSFVIGLIVAVVSYAFLALAARAEARR